VEDPFVCGVQKQSVRVLFVRETRLVGSSVGRVDVDVDVDVEVDVDVGYAIKKMG
jgi:hypothetical protein